MSQCSTAAPRPSGSGIKLISKKSMAADLESCVKTIDRLRDSDADFPELTRIGRRDFAQEGAWEDYKKRLVARGLNRKPASPRGIVARRAAT